MNKEVLRGLGLSVCHIFAHSKVEGSGGMLPQGNFRKRHALRLIFGLLFTYMYKDQILVSNAI